MGINRSIVHQMRAVPIDLKLIRNTSQQNEIIALHSDRHNGNFFFAVKLKFCIASKSSNYIRTNRYFCFILFIHVLFKALFFAETLANPVGSLQDQIASKIEQHKRSLSNTKKNIDDALFYARLAQKSVHGTNYLGGFVGVAPNKPTLGGFKRDVLTSIDGDKGKFERALAARRAGFAAMEGVDAARAVAHKTSHAVQTTATKVAQHLPAEYGSMNPFEQ